MPKEKSITELRDEKQQLATRSKAIIAEARAANDGKGRQFTSAEEEEIGRNQLRMAEINLELAEREAENRGKGKPHAAADGRFSLRRAIKNMCDVRGRPTSRRRSLRRRVLRTMRRAYRHPTVAVSSSP